MRSRFPHGGEVLGAAPANPILAPVLSQDRGLSMSRQRELLDLQAIQRIPGLVGYWKSDPQYLFEDSAGTTPASTSGTGPIGQWRAVQDSQILGSELTDTMNTLGAWSLSGTNTLTVTDGVFTATYVDSQYGGFATLSAAAGLSSDLVVGDAYLLTGEARSVSGNGFTINVTSNVGTPLSQGAVSFTSSSFSSFEIVFIPTATNTNQIRTYSLGTGDVVEWKNLSIKKVISLSALQSVTANKPILRKTPTTGIYWADSNTATSALNVALGNLGSACTVARSGAEGVTFTENVSITSTYNIAPAFSFNSDVAIFNRALTTTEKALITRYMARAVPMLGANRIVNGAFDTDLSGWTVTLTDGTHTITWDAGAVRFVLSSATPVAKLSQANVFNTTSGYMVKFDASFDTGTNLIFEALGYAFTAGAKNYVIKPSITGCGFYRSATPVDGRVDNITAQEIL